MPKLKTHSGSKKRFQVKAAKGGRSPEVLRTQAFHKHLMRKKGSDMRRNSRGAVLTHAQEAQNLLKYFLPYAR